MVDSAVLFHKKMFRPIEFVQFDARFDFKHVGSAEYEKNEYLGAQCRILRKELGGLCEWSGDILVEDFMDKPDDIRAYLKCFSSLCDMHNGLKNFMFKGNDEDIHEYCEKNNIDFESLEISSLIMSVKYMDINGLKVYLKSIAEDRDVYGEKDDVE